MLKLSIITTVYNSDLYLKQSLDSVLNQKLDNYELIVVDDGSFDASRSILEEYSGLPVVKLLENKYNEGVAFSRNRALNSARGEYIAIHDSDDISLANRFNKEIDILDSDKKITFLGGHATKISHSGATIGSMCYPPKTTIDGIKCIVRHKLNPIIDSSSMFRKKEIIENGGYSLEDKHRTAQDFELWCRLLSRNFQMTNIQEPLIQYRINPNGVSQTRKQEQTESTNLIWAAFCSRNFKDRKFNHKLYNLLGDGK